MNRVSSLEMMPWDKGNTRANICELLLLLAGLSARCLAFVVYFILLTILEGGGLLVSWVQLRFPHVKAAFCLAMEPGFELRDI